jgi:hypothetical protein
MKHRTIHTPHTYTLHTFDTSCPDMSIIGEASPMSILPPLHGHSVTLSDHVSGEPLPPQGVFDWHYMRCAISHFAAYARGFLTSKILNIPSQWL